MRKTLKKLTGPWMIFIITLSFLGLMLLILLIVYAQTLTIDPEGLVEEYAKFLGGIVSMLFGFYLVNVLWDQRMKAYQIGRFKKVLAHFYLKIHTFCQQIKQLISQDFSTGEEEKSLLRDHQVQGKLYKLRSLGQGIENYSPEVDLIEDDTLREMVVAIWTDIRTNIERLPVEQDFHLDLDEFKETIDALIDSTEHAMTLLGL